MATKIVDQSPPDDHRAENRRRQALDYAATLAGPGFGSGSIQASNVVNAAAEFERYLKYGGKSDAER